ncbi:MAG: phosphotransferase [Sciscionella sp.]
MLRAVWARYRQPGTQSSRAAWTRCGPPIASSRTFPPRWSRPGWTCWAPWPEEVSPVARPAVAHLDVYMPNILLDDEGGFRVLLDLEHLRWVDPVMDFVKPAMWMFPDQQSWAEAFADGYQAAGPWPACWSERLAVATGMELLTGVEYWTRVADHAMREDYLRRLRVWVRSDGADHVWSAISPATWRA